MSGERLFFQAEREFSLTNQLGVEYDILIRNRFIPAWVWNNSLQTRILLDLGMKWDAMSASHKEYISECIPKSLLFKIVYTDGMAWSFKSFYMKE